MLTPQSLQNGFAPGMTLLSEALHLVAVEEEFTRKCYCSLYARLVHIEPMKLEQFHPMPAFHFVRNDGKPTKKHFSYLSLRLRLYRGD